MPSQTFFNLSEEKRQRIIDAAMEEFSNLPFAKASVAGIVERAGIPRGSFYQYFEDLKDVYKYLMDLVGQQKIIFMQDFIANMQEMEAFELIREMYRIGLEFAKVHPELAAIGSNFFKEDSQLKEEIYGDFESRFDGFFGQILAKGQVKGEIDQKIDVKVASFMFFSMNLFLVDYYLEMSKKDNIFDDIDEFLEVSDKMLYIMEYGIKGKNLDSSKEE